VTPERRFGYSTAPRPPYEFVPVKCVGEPRCPEAYRSRILIDTVHDGAVIPEPLLKSPRVKWMHEDGSLWEHFLRERDWGANLVAAHVAKELGLDGYYRITVARVVMDFNRFPGCSYPGATPLERLAISDPMARNLNHLEKRYVLEQCYDVISDEMEKALEGKFIRLAIHSYDAHNLSMTERPATSLLSRSISYQQNSKLPYGTFDPLFPDILAESSCKPILRDRLALTLEKAGISVEHNYPYCLPDGSLEIRAQPWLFFRRLKRLFEEDFPHTTDDPSYAMVWYMLLNTNMRRADSGTLSAYFHRFRRAPEGRKNEFERARQAYETISEYLRSQPTMINDYRRSHHRTSAMSIEVRKDLVWSHQGEASRASAAETASLIGKKIAEAIEVYLKEDREAEEDA
jgi:hypothetical protein